MEELIRQGYITARRHPTLPLTIYNYTKQTQYEGYWNGTTKKCRGLVLDDTGEIIVNAPPKFFNKGEPFADRVNLRRALLLEKLDGFYISVTKSSKYGLIITSRGSFDSQYALAAKRFITPAIEENLIPDISYFCELCQNFPGDESIIVARHHDPCFVCWAIRTQEGEELNPYALSPFPCVKRFSYQGAKEYLTEEVEGIVAFDPKTGHRVKAKTDWYLERHRIISGFSKRRIWEVMRDGNLVSEFIEIDELLPQAFTWQRELMKEFNEIWRAVQDADSETSHLTDKELGLLDNYQNLKPYLFMLRKDKEQECISQIWKAIKPRCDVV